MAKNAITLYAQKVVDEFSKRITDEVFQMIENDRNLFQEYLRLVSDNNLDTVNQIIGKIIKKRFQLKNIDERQEEPFSKLIKSHQKF